MGLVPLRMFAASMGMLELGSGGFAFKAWCSCGVRSAVNRFVGCVAFGTVACVFGFTIW